MKAASANLLSIIKGPKQFVIPIYQRTYSWHQIQCEQLFQDILRISQSKQTLGDSQGHFVGSVVYFQESIHTVSDVPRLLVIDGQQRLTTITLLITALADFISYHPDLLETNATKLKNYYLFNAEEDGDLRYKLLLTRRDKQTLIELLSGITPSEPASQRLLENYRFFKANINSRNAVAVYNGLMRLFVVDVALEKDVDNPQLIFESLNSTGLDLSQADLIRNYVLMGQEVKLQTELYEKFWYPMEQNYGNEYSKRFDWFMRDYLSVKTGSITNIGHVYEAFKQFAVSDQSPNSISALVEDIHRFSGFYVNMVLHKEPSTLLQKAFKRISRLKVDVSYPFLLAVYADYADQLVSEQEFEQILCLVENYVFRRAICGIPTNSLNKTFATLYQSVRKENYFESVQAAFLLLSGYKRFPSDAEFNTELVAKDVYNFRNRNYLLDRLENHQRKEHVVIDVYTIEHILPQNSQLSPQWQTMLGENWQAVQESYLHTLGNLTLTAYNSELSDRSFSEKKSIEGGFDQSPIKLNDFLRKTTIWNAEQIQLRAQALADKAEQIWFTPKLNEDKLAQYRPVKTSNQEYTIEQYEHLKGDMLELYKALKQRILNIDASVTEEYKKLYIAFKASTNFVDIVPQKSRLRLSLNMAYPDIVDPKGLCKDVSAIGRWGNGDVEVGLSNLNEIDEIMELIQQAFDVQSD
jgi:uncharacterized protein with ParB-like and HNH nuclease domain/predicted transport protein